MISGGIVSRIKNRMKRMAMENGSSGRGSGAVVGGGLLAKK